MLCHGTCHRGYPIRITKEAKPKNIETECMKKNYRIVYDKRVIIEITLFRQQRSQNIIEIMDIIIFSIVRENTQLKYLGFYNLTCFFTFFMNYQDQILSNTWNRVSTWLSAKNC